MIVLIIIGYAFIGAFVLKIADMVFGRLDGEGVFFCSIGWPITVIVLCCVFMYNLPDYCGDCFNAILKAIRFILGK